VLEGGCDILLREPEGLGDGAGGRPAVTGERTERQCLDGSILWRRLLAPPIGDHPLGKVVGALKVASFADCELAGGPQGGSDLLGDLEVPPTLAAATLHVE